MHNFSLAHLSDAALLRELTTLVGRDRLNTAELLSHIGEVDVRRLYAPAGHPSMFAYCVDELRLSEDAAGRRIHAARAARRFPALLTALADGRLHLTAVCLLAPHLTPENVKDLIQVATHTKKAEIEVMLARRFSAPEPQVLVRPLPPAPPVTSQHALAHIGSGSEAPRDSSNEYALAHIDEPVAASAEGPMAASAKEPAAPPAEERYLVQVTISKSTYDKLRYAQELLSHAIASRDVAGVLDRALDSLISQLEKQKFGAAMKPQKRERHSKSVRHVPAHVRRAVWERDRGQCTFFGPDGRRCTAKKLLEFDHAEPVARGGKATVSNMRLRCRAHNQYEAERIFGAGYMNQRRNEAGLGVARESGKLNQYGLRTRTPSTVRPCRCIRAHFDPERHCLKAKALPEGKAEGTRCIG